MAPVTAWHEQARRGTVWHDVAERICGQVSGCPASGRPLFFATQGDVVAGFGGRQTSAPEAARVPVFLGLEPTAGRCISAPQVGAQAHVGVVSGFGLDQLDAAASGSPLAVAFATAS